MHLKYNVCEFSNNLLGVKMLFEIKKTKALAKVFIFETINILTPRRLLYKKFTNKNIILILQLTLDDRLLISRVCMSGIKYARVYIQF